MVSAPQRLPAIRRLARCNRGFALMMGAEAALALCIVRVAEFTGCTIRHGVRATTHIALAHDDVTELVFALLVLRAHHVVA